MLLRLMFVGNRFIFDEFYLESIHTYLISDRDRRFHKWKKAVERSMHWVSIEEEADKGEEPGDNNHGDSNHEDSNHGDSNHGDSNHCAP